MDCKAASSSVLAKSFVTVSPFELARPRLRLNLNRVLLPAGRLSSNRDHIHGTAGVMSTDRLTVSYEDPAHAWPAAQEALRSLLPLEKLELPSTHSSLSMRRLPTVNLHFITWNSVTAASKDILELWKQPYLHLFLLPIDDPSQLQNKGRLQSWLEALAQRKGPWGLVLFVTGGTNGTTRPPSVDLSSGGKTVRSAILRLGAAGPELVESLRFACASAFQAQLLGLEEEVRRLEARRPFPGWNFCTYFVCKENMAIHYSRVGLDEDALQQYDQLETTLAEVESSLEGQMTGFDSENSSPHYLTQPFGKWALPEVRKTIYENSVELSSIRAYIFAKQSHLMLSLGRTSELLARARRFITIECIKLEEIGAEEREKWSLRTTLALLSLSGAFAEEPLNSIQQTELFIVAKSNLERLAEPRIPAFARKHSLSALPLLSLAVENHLSRDMGEWDLEEILDSPALFDTAHGLLVHRAIEGCARFKLFRKCNGLKRDRVALNIAFGRFRDAVNECREMLLKGGLWDALEEDIRVKMAKCYKGLGETTLYMETCIGLLDRPTSMRTISVTKLFDDMISSPASDGSEIPLNAISARITTTSTIDKIEVLVQNHLSALSCDEILAEVYSEEQPALLKLKNDTLSVGENLVSFYPKRALYPGSYFLKSFTLTINSRHILCQVDSNGACLGADSGAALKAYLKSFKYDYINDVTIAIVECRSLNAIMRASICARNGQVGRLQIDGIEIDVTEQFELSKSASCNVSIELFGKLQEDDLIISGSSSDGHAHTAIVHAELLLPFSVKLSQRIRGNSKVCSLCLSTQRTLELVSVQKVGNDNELVALSFYDGIHERGNVTIVYEHLIDQPIPLLRISYKVDGGSVEDFDIQMQDEDPNFMVDCHINDPIYLHRPQTVSYECHVPLSATEAAYSFEATNPSDWMVMGKTSGLIQSPISTVPLTLMALRPGCIPLPHIQLEHQGHRNNYSEGYFVDVQRAS